MVLVTVSLVIALAAAPHSQRPPLASTSISIGRVVAAANGRPIAGAIVTLFGSAVVNGADALDVPFTVAANGHTASAIVTFGDRKGELTGALQDAGGGPATDYSILLFPTSPAQWLPHTRRIQTVRPSADRAFAFRNLPLLNR